jgi:histidinol-phosphate/aromatic aminotransferase/cobyric acid decarboxylase-like protein
VYQFGSIADAVIVLRLASVVVQGQPVVAVVDCESVAVLRAASKNYSLPAVRGGICLGVG